LGGDKSKETTHEFDRNRKCGNELDIYNQNLYLSIKNVSSCIQTEATCRRGSDNHLIREKPLHFVRQTEEVTVRTTTQVAPVVIHLMAVDIWVGGSSFPFLQAITR
jgi:hypothetical protein